MVKWTKLPRLVEPEGPPFTKDSVIAFLIVEGVLILVSMVILGVIPL